MRARIRHSSHRSSDFGNQHLSTEHDLVYNARDVQAPSARAHRVHEIASLIVSWPQKLEVSRNIGKELYDLATVSNFLLPFDSSKPLSELLALPMHSYWAPLHNTCRLSSSGTDTYRLLFLFSTIAYGIAFTSTTWLKTLLAFAFVPELRETYYLPKYSSYNLEDGAEYDETLVRQVVRDHLRSLMSPGDGIRTEAYIRSLKVFRERRPEQLHAIVDEYSSRWPCSEPLAPDSATYDYFDVHEIHPKVVALFSSWLRNADFYSYLQQVHQIRARVHERAPRVPYVTWQQLEEEPEAQKPRKGPSLAEVMAAVPSP